jgi:ubiquinone/menaquinone biosynthesis C-methylase UbiE
MEDERLIELLVELHEGLPRLGPGNDESTLGALALCEHLPARPAILDVGCGTGAQTLVLAESTDGHITAVDLIPNFLAKLDYNVVSRGLEDRIEIQEGDMRELPFPEESFDLVWSEGAIYIMGFDNGLSEWRRFVKPGGYLVVSEVSWFRPDPPREVAEFWAENYPAIRTVEENLEAAKERGWLPVGHFHLPKEGWVEDYYKQLGERLPEFRRANAEDPDAQAVADLTAHEMSMYSRYSEAYGYEFYVFRRID